MELHIDTSRKIDAGRRTEAVLWGVKHGFTPDDHRIDHWRRGSEVADSNRGATGADPRASR